jgi:hypothetical protein
MEYALDMKRDGEVLRVRVSGTVERDVSGSAPAQAQRIASAAEECRGILLDVREASIEIDLTDRFDGLAAFARVLPPGMRLAVLGVPAHLTADTFARDVAENRGLLYRTFDDETEALGWLVPGS